MRHLNNNYLPDSSTYIRYLSIAAIFLMLTAFVPVNWQLNRSSVTFKIKNAGITVNGSLGGTQADINFDPANPVQSSIAASLETATIETGIGLRDKHLQKALYFHTDKYPKITVRSTKIEKTGDKSYVGYFDLTIKGTTKNIQVPFTFTENAGSGDFKGEFRLNRLDYKVGESSWLMDNEVQVFIQLNVTR